MCGARLFPVRVTTLQRYKPLPAPPPDLSPPRMHITESRNGRLAEVAAAVQRIDEQRAGGGAG